MKKSLNRKKVDKLLMNAEIETQLRSSQKIDTI